MKQELVETDVLCIGGGIAGLMAAIRAAELGAKVVVAEKANTLRSGAGATGNDHFRCYIPDFHGQDIEPIVTEVLQSQVGVARTRKQIHTWMENSFDIVKLWDSWGIPMKYGGNWEFSGHAFPGRPLTTLKYAGQNQKPILTKKALTGGVEIINRVMAFDLLADNGCCAGAIGIGTREEKITIFKAKSVVMGTGVCVGLYPSPTPGWLFNRANPPSTTGDGRAMAYRAGAELINMELPQRWAGPKYFARCGKGTWIGLLKDSQGRVLNPFMGKPDRKYGDAIADAHHSLFEEYHRMGKGPVYMDCRGISREDHDYMMYGLTNEGNLALIDYLQKEGIDVTKHAVEFMTYEITCRGGVSYNEKAETSLSGLFAAGDEYFGGISNAAVFGWIAGEAAAKHARSMSLHIEAQSSKCEETIGIINQIRHRKNGATWQEANIALQQIMQDYAGLERSDSLLNAGLTYIIRLKTKANASMIARNQHELIHCIELFNLFDIAELIFLASIQRKETRGGFKRSDYPFTNPILDGKTLVCKISDGKPNIEWR